MEIRIKILIACAIALAFLTGFLANFALPFYIDKENPFLLGFSGTKEQPGNWISQDKIQILEDKVIINIKDAVISEYADTGSMLPTLGENANGIKIKPENPEQINIGDIISFQQGNLLIVHRVIDKGKDANGWYFITKGDNNQETDGKVYFSDVKYVTVALIY